MKYVRYDEARARLSTIMDRVCADHSPLLVTRPGKRSVVLVSEEDYNARIALISTREPRP